MEETKRKPKKQLSPEKLEAKKKRDAKKFNQFVVCATMLYMMQLTDKERKFYITQIVPLEPAQTERESIADKQVVFRIEINGYVIWFYTAYLPDEGIFAENKAVQIVVTKASRPGGKVHYIARFHDSYFNADNVCFELQFIWDRLRYNRPVLLGKLADIHYLPKKGIYQWRSVYKTKVEGRTITKIATRDFYKILPLKPGGLTAHVYDRRDKKTDEAEERILKKRIPLAERKKKRKKLPVDRTEKPERAVVQLELKGT